MDLASVVRRYIAEGTGQLALKFADTTHLCKVNIEDGEAVFIKLGLLSPEETLAMVNGKVLLEANFIKGFKTRKRLPEPITSQLLGAGVNDETSPTADSSKGTIATGVMVAAQDVSKMINHYIDIVGPLGVVMMENYVKSIDYVQGQNMNSNNYNELLSNVLLDLPEAFREEFQQTHR